MNAIEQKDKNTDNQKKLKTNYILIDYENVQPSTFELPKDYPFKVIVFVGASQTKIPIDLVIAMQNLGHNAQYVRVEEKGKNALDFYITFYLGKYFEKDSMGYFHIISKDTGFDILIQHLKSKKVLVNRYSQIEDIPALKKVLNSKFQADEKVKIIVDYLIKRGNSKPRKVDTLSNTINSLFARELNDKEIAILVKLLADKKYIKIEEKKVHYTLKK
jgi:hypothetical protein